MQLEGTAAGLQTEGCEHGIPNEHGCFSARCPSRCSSAQCRRSSASGFPHSRFCQAQGNTFGAVRDVMLQSKANRKFKKRREQITGSLLLLGGCQDLLCYSHDSHVVLWLHRDLQHFGPVHHSLHAGCGDSLPGDAVDLVKGVWFQELLIRGADVNLKPQLSSTLVPTKLVKSNQRI